MAFGEQNKKKTGFQILTQVVVVLMLILTVFGVLAAALSALN